ncbi:MAG: hypothetical protein OXG98_07370, partial [Gemmatimonadetes bacterium]|nr:hypothetical protein [Gemmatimonadota bacterium]
ELGGLTERGQRRKFARKLYRLSRALIGDELADKLRFPRQNTRALLPTLRWKRRLNSAVAPLASVYSRDASDTYFIRILESIKPENLALTYKLPPQLYSDERIDW